MSETALTDAFIYDGIRTPFGRHAGALAPVRPDDLLAHVIRTVVEKNGFPKEAFEDVIAGNTNQAGEDCRNVARFASLLAGMPVEVGGLTVNRLCASGLAATLHAANSVKIREGELFVAGGVESMSRAPLVLSKAHGPYDRGQALADSTLGARLPTPPSLPGLVMTRCRKQQTTSRRTSRFPGRQRPLCCGFSAKYEAARADGFFENEIVAIDVPQGRKNRSYRRGGRAPRPQTTLESLSGLRTLFDNGVVTAGNASGINDGAAALIVGSREAGERYGVKPRARIVAGAVAGVEPRVMGFGPVFAIRKALRRADLQLSDMDIIEINEAFASQVLGCLKLLDVDFSDSRVNPNGGAIAMGHPLGASGARIALTALRQLERGGGRYAAISLCIGIGQGLAAILERVD